jgi:uncharacterized protein YbaR (Trm112 family)
MISKELLDVLCCPIGKAPLKQEDDSLICTFCGVVYQIKDGIPILLTDEAVLPDGINSISELKCRKTGHDS